MVQVLCGAGCLRDATRHFLLWSCDSRQRPLRGARCRTSKEDLELALGRLQFNVDRHNREAGLGYELQYSVGAQSFEPERHAVIAQFMAETDKLMYAQKRGRQQARGRFAAPIAPAFAAA